MATKYLRKIILEELQEVLKEDQAAFTQTGRSVTRLGSGTQVGGYADKLTAAQKAEAQKLVDASQGRLTFEQAAQQVAAKAMGTGAIESGQGRSGSERIIAATTKPSRNQIFDLQRQLVKLGLLRSRQVDGIYGPNTQRATALYASSLDPSGKFTGKEVSKFSANDVSVIANDIKTMNRQQIAQARKDVASSRIVKAPAVQSNVSATPTSPVTTDNFGVTKTETEPDLSFLPKSETKEEKAERYKRQEEERRKAQQIQQKTSDIQESQQESITREINKLLKML